jgi:hypothetical protein
MEVLLYWGPAVTLSEVVQADMVACQTMTLSGSEA